MSWHTKGGACQPAQVVGTVAPAHNRTTTSVGNMLYPRNGTPSGNGNRTRHCKNTPLPPYVHASSLYTGNNRGGRVRRRWLVKMKFPGLTPSLACRSAGQPTPPWPPAPYMIIGPTCEGSRLQAAVTRSTPDRVHTIPTVRSCP